MAHQALSHHPKLLFHNRAIPLGKRVELFQMLVLTKFLHGADSWIALDSKTQQKKLQTGMSTIVYQQMVTTQIVRFWWPAAFRAHQNCSEELGCDTLQHWSSLTTLMLGLSWHLTLIGAALLRKIWFGCGSNYITPRSSRTRANIIFNGFCLFRRARDIGRSLSAERVNTVSYSARRDNKFEICTDRLLASWGISYQRRSWLQCPPLPLMMSLDACSAAGVAEAERVKMLTCSRNINTFRNCVPWVTIQHAHRDWSTSTRCRSSKRTYNERCRSSTAATFIVQLCQAPLMLSGPEAMTACCRLCPIWDHINKRHVEGRGLTLMEIYMTSLSTRVPGRPSPPWQDQGDCDGAGYLMDEIASYCAVLCWHADHRRCGGSEFWLRAVHHDVAETCWRGFMGVFAVFFHRPDEEIWNFRTWATMHTSSRSSAMPAACCPTQAVWTTSSFTTPYLREA